MALLALRVLALYPALAAVEVGVRMAPIQRPNQEAVGMVASPAAVVAVAALA